MRSSRPAQSSTSHWCTCALMATLLAPAVMITPCTVCARFIHFYRQWLRRLLQSELMSHLTTARGHASGRDIARGARERCRRRRRARGRAACSSACAALRTRGTPSRPRAQWPSATSIMSDTAYMYACIYIYACICICVVLAIVYSCIST